MAAGRKSGNSPQKGVVSFDKEECVLEKVRDNCGDAVLQLLHACFCQYQQAGEQVPFGIRHIVPGPQKPDFPMAIIPPPPTGPPPAPLTSIHFSLALSQKLRPGQNQIRNDFVFFKTVYIL